MGLGLQPSDYEEQQGALVREVYPNTPASEAGLQSGDIITTFDDQNIEDIDAFIRLVGSYRAGDTVSLNIIRGRKEKRLSVTLGSRPSQQDLSAGRFLQPSLGDWGIQTTLTQGFGNDIEQGLVVIQMKKSSPLRGLIQLGDIILRINDIPATQTSLSTVSPRQPTTFTVWRQGQVQKFQYEG